MRPATRRRRQGAARYGRRRAECIQDDLVGRRLSGPLRSLGGLVLRRPSVAAGGTRQGLMLWRSALRADCTAMLGPGSRRRTHYASCARCVQTTAASQITKRAARADPGPALLVATEIAPAGYRLPRVPPLSSLLDKNLDVSAKARAGSRRRASAQPRSAGLVARARSALRYLTRRGCLNGANAVRAVSSAAGPRDRAPQGTLAKRGQAVKRRRLPARAFARAKRREQGRK